MISFLRIERFVARLADKMNWFAAAALVFMMLLTVFDVIGRFFKSPIPGTYELVAFTGGVVISLALPYTSVEKGHIAVEVLVQKLPWIARVIINVVNALVGSILFAIIAWQCMVYAGSMKASAQVSLTIKMPIHPFILGIAVGCALLSVVLFIEFVSQLRGAEPE